MAFIKVRNLKKNSAGQYQSGTAAVVDVSYDADAAGHSRQTVRERLGKVAWLSDDKKEGIFLSPTRGLVFYDVRSDEFKGVSRDDPRVEGCAWIPPAQNHANFGDAYLLLSFLKRSGFLGVLMQVFEEQELRERLLAHVLHGFLRDGSSIKCSTFIEQSAAAYLLPNVVLSNLACDYRYFQIMGKDSTKLSFFRALVAWMRRKEPEFGKGCYVDSTELPSEAKDNPYVHLRTERGVSKEEMRMALVLDEQSGLPVWYTLFPGNLMDVNTLRNVIDDVRATLNVEVDSLVLDSGYAKEETIRAYADGKHKSVIVRMPARRGYPYKALYHKFRKQFDQPRYIFMRDDSVYYGRREELTLFGVDLFAYVYVDKERALEGYKRFMKNHPEEYADSKYSERQWIAVRQGYFVLLSNKEESPAVMLDRYIARVHIEAVFKSAKSFEGLMPLAKWDLQTVRGKILQDVILTIIRSLLLQATTEYKGSLADIFHEAASIACFMENNDWLRVETANKQARLAYSTLGITVPGSVRLDEWRRRMLSSSSDV